MTVVQPGNPKLYEVSVLKRKHWNLYRARRDEIETKKLFAMENFTNSSLVGNRHNVVGQSHDRTQRAREFARTFASYRWLQTYP